LLQAYRRVKSRKSRLAADILETIKARFRKPEFDDQPGQIRDYVCWALNGGPAYYASPTPQTCKVKRGEPGYIVSTFVIAITLLGSLINVNVFY
jgi:hypothetical protein